MLLFSFPQEICWNPTVWVLWILVNRTEQNRTEQNRTEQNRTEQNRTEQNRTEQNRTEQNRTEQNRTEQNRTEQNRTEQNRTEQNRSTGVANQKDASHSIAFSSQVDGMDLMQLVSVFSAEPL